MFEQLHLDVYQLIFAYLTQQDLLDMLLINHTFYQQIMKYIPKLKIYDHKALEYFGRFNMIISIKLNTLTAIDWNWNFGLLGACEGGHKRFVELMIEKGADNWDLGLFGACLGGHKMLVELMIDKGADYWNYALYGACKGGHRMLAEWMISKGANNFDWGLQGACEGGNKMLAELMISKGANYWDKALCKACEGGHKTLVELMIEKGAACCGYCNKSMEEHCESNQ